MKYTVSSRKDTCCFVRFLKYECLVIARITRQLFLIVTMPFLLRLKRGYYLQSTSLSPCHLRSANVNYVDK